MPKKIITKFETYPYCYEANEYTHEAVVFVDSRNKRMVDMRRCLQGNDWHGCSANQDETDDTDLTDEEIQFYLEEMKKQGLIE